jgi:hypothetical protein
MIEHDDDTAVDFVELFETMVKFFVDKNRPDMLRKMQMSVANGIEEIKNKSDNVYYKAYRIVNDEPKYYEMKFTKLFDCRKEFGNSSIDGISKFRTCIHCNDEWLEDVKL